MAHTPHLQPGIKQCGLILNGKIFNRAHRGQELEPNMKEVLQGEKKKRVPVSKRALILGFIKTLSKTNGQPKANLTKYPIVSRT